MKQLALLFLVAACRAVCAAEGTVELPTLTVTEMPEPLPPESWRYTKAGSFEVLSNASAETTRRLVEEFQMFDRALRIVWPSLPGALPSSSPLIFCARGGKFDQFLPRDVAGKGGVGTLCLHGPDRAAI